LFADVVCVTEQCIIGQLGYVRVQPRHQPVAARGFATGFRHTRGRGKPQSESSSGYNRT
jgi:hypothetical protein